jgi:hypothetical protein
MAAWYASFRSIAARLITDFEMTAVTLVRAATVIAFFGAFICAGASIPLAAPQTSLTASVPNRAAVGATVIGHWRVHAEPAEKDIGGVLNYSTGIAAVVTDAYGLSVLGVLPVGPFVFARWQIGRCPDTNGRNSANQNQGSPANSQHVTFVWPAT